MRELNKKIEDLFDTMLEYTDVPEFEQQHLLMATWIFSTTVLRFMWELQKNENIEQVDRENMAEAFGKEMNAIVKKYTNIDMRDVRIYPEKKESL
jgi:hypothetical protein